MAATLRITRAAFAASVRATSLFSRICFWNTPTVASYAAEIGATRIDEPAQSVLMPQQSSNS
jgi:hypothetical protein